MVDALSVALLRHSALPLVPSMVAVPAAPTVAPLLSSRWQLALSWLSASRLPAANSVTLTDTVRAADALTLSLAVMLTG